jgi:glycosyltransferase involved in cell wall biosynthesis
MQSRAEPFGRIPLEAYAAGASPVIATTAGGLAEIVTSDIDLDSPAGERDHVEQHDPSGPSLAFPNRVGVG